MHTGFGLAGLVLLIVDLAFTSLAKGQEIPALLDLPAAIAITHADLTAWHDRLVQERGALRTRVGNHDAQCSAVEQGSAEEARCRASRAQLAADRNSHIAESNDFNRAVGRAKGVCVKSEGYQLIWAIQGCPDKRPSIISHECLKGLGITEKSLACLATIPAAVARAPFSGEAAIVACGIAATIPLDAYIQCGDIEDACVTKALQAHKESTGKCLR